MNVPGKRLLKIVSILFIIFGAIVTVISIIGLIVYVMNADSLFGELSGIIIVALIPILVVSVLELILGIVGLKKCGDPTKGGFFITRGIILCALSLVSLILSIVGGSFHVTSLGIKTGMLTIIGFVLQFLYIIGGSMNKKASIKTYPK